MREDDLIPPNESLGDHVHTLARAGIASIPLVGGAAVELFNSIIAPPIVQRRNEWMTDLAEKLLRLADEKKINIEDLKAQPQFIDVVLQATQAAIRSHQSAKHEALRNAVLNSALPGSPESSTQLVFINAIDSFTEWHIRILVLFRDPRKWASERGIAFRDQTTGGLRDILLQAYPQLQDKDSFYRQVWRDLHTSGLLISEWTGATMTMDGMLSKRTTDWGDQFLRFITEP